MTLARQDRISRKLVRTVLIVGLALLAAVPLYYVLVSSFKNSADMALHPLSLPSSWDFANYVQAAADGTIFRSLLNSLIVTVVGVLFQIIIGSLAAYGMLLKKNVLTSAVGVVLLIAFTIPLQATLLPLFKLEADANLVDSLAGLIVIYLGGAVFCYFLTVGYMRQLPWELFEAARIDGAGYFRIYWSICLPLIRPILATVAVFQALGTWNDFITPNVFISSPQNRTVVLQVYNAVTQFTTNWPLFMAIIVIALIPVVVFFIICQRWIVSGLVSGAVKG
ncbi:carbohydrate ABC transporter permease [Curtobacterium sp. MCBD17_040]|uniref:carbohydrate ABC transporter permease n=1 Tax=Curtobacterium sp. MCBD17_040 TaxID=2175674 RepID=UPI000DAA0B80|nr:carbohydrate ABC transporter permease [Curtobacterium sp. MCBD17_040]WIB65263.1 carbohydrate ABC transporter permease [Curtobacterium sp. MCBD17_040]